MTPSMTDTAGPPQPSGNRDARNHRTNAIDMIETTMERAPTDLVMRALEYPMTPQRIGRAPSGRDYVTLGWDPDDEATGDGNRHDDTDDDTDDDTPRPADMYLLCVDRGELGASADGQTEADPAVWRREIERDAAICQTLRNGEPDTAEQTCGMIDAIRHILAEEVRRGRLSAAGDPIAGDPIAGDPSGNDHAPPAAH